jgi:hypothetical protein
MPGPFRLRPRADETQELGVVRLIHCDREVAKFAAMQPRTERVWASIDYWLERRYRITHGGDGAP